MSRTTTTLQERVRELAEEVVSGSAMFVVDVQVRGARGSQVAEVFLDGDEPVGLDDFARVSRELGFLLETEEIFGSKYDLRVSSPGAERPLRLPRQFRKHVGRELVVQYREAEAEEPAFADGQLTEVDDETLVIDTEEDGARRIPFDQIEDARIRLPW